MPEINGKPVNNLKKNRGCGCSSCCLFPYGNRNDEEEQVIVDYMDDATCPHYIDDLPEPFEPGTIIKIKGYVQPICSRFAVNLTSSRDAGSDIALHLNPRISQRYIVRNSRIRHHWGKEEVTTISAFELNRSQKFELDIVASEREFLVSVNGKHVCAFVYRVALNTVKVLQIEGPVEIYGVEYGETQTYPANTKTTNSFSLPPGGDTQEICSTGELILPFTINLDEGFQPGWQLEIDGRVKILPINFVINLQDGSQLWPHPNIYLHLNPRFGYNNTKHVFVQNAWMDGQWGPEERIQTFPFEPAATFKMAIRRNAENFSIWVNGSLVAECRFRGPIEKINTLYIQGDLVIQRVCMRRRVDDHYFQKSRHSLISEGDSYDG